MYYFNEPLLPFIRPDILLRYGAILKNYSKKEVIFNEGEHPKYYTQIDVGCVRQFNVFEDGREFTQGIFCSGESFGEPPIFINMKYPSSAEALIESKIFILPIDKFHTMINENTTFMKLFLELMAKRIYGKSINSLSLALRDSPDRIFDFFKKLQANNQLNQTMQIPFTRQEIANFLGLRVETVIRIINQLKNEGKLKIVNRKIFLNN